MKLFTIGDSISQGFMSMAAARTELSYSTLLARCVGLVAGTDEYSLPMWGAGGLPFNIENLMRSLQRQYGTNIRGPIEWLAAVASVNGFLDDIEDHYERGQGNIALPQANRRQFYPNVSVAGFTVADAWKVTPRMCLDRIAMDQQKNGGDGVFFSLPNCRFACGCGRPSVPRHAGMWCRTAWRARRRRAAAQVSQAQVPGRTMLVIEANIPQEPLFGRSLG